VSIALPDVNVLVAAAWPSHVHHTLARRWLMEALISGWATCPMTQAGFARVSSNPSIIDGAVPPGDALQLLAELSSAGRHEFWADDIDLTVDVPEPFRAAMGHRQMTDAYLLSLAALHRGCLVTLDRSLPALVSPASVYRDAVTVLAAD
jgi:uncharacterized protein